MKTVVIRCRKCWADVALQKEDAPLPNCSECGLPETYRHGYVPKGTSPKSLKLKKAASKC